MGLGGRVTSVDVQHGFKLENTNVNMMVLPGQVARLSHTFNEAGEYPYACTEYCGVGHQNMFGKIRVVSQEEAVKSARQSVELVTQALPHCWSPKAHAAVQPPNEQSGVVPPQAKPH